MNKKSCSLKKNDRGHDLDMQLQMLVHLNPETTLLSSPHIQYKTANNARSHYAQASNV